MDTPQLTPNMTVAEILDRWPAAAVVFQQLRTACVGCVMAPFCSVNDAATHYDLDAGRLLTELNVVVKLAEHLSAEGV
jgi:hybrid cluster-associated redox disulfide protein